MEAPVAKPRSVVSEPLKRPVPAPRTRLNTPVTNPSPNDPRPTAADLLRSLGSVSKQLSEDVAARVTHSAKSANEKIERSLQDGSRFAKDTLEKTISTSRAVRDSVTKSVLEGTRAGLRLRRSKRGNSSDVTEQRCVSMPPMDVSLFDNIQFHSPLLEQKRYRDEEDGGTNEDFSSLNLNASHLDDTSIFSSNSDSNTDTVSNFSYDSRESENTLSLISENEQLTYDTPKSSRTNSIVSSTSTPEVPLRRKRRESQLEIMRLNSMYENWTLPHETPLSNTDCSNSSRPSKSTIFEFDPLNESSAANRFEGISNELLLLESFLKGEECASNDGQEEYGDAFNESEYYNPPTPPERSDSLFPAESEPKASTANNNKERNSNWYVDTDELANTSEVAEETVKSNSSVKQKISSMLKLDVLNKSVKHNGAQKESEVERPPINQLPVPHFSGTLSIIHTGGVQDLFKSTASRYCVLSDQKLKCYSDPTNSILKEAFPLDTINSVQVVLPLSACTSNNSYWLELSVCEGGGGGGGARRAVLGCSSAAERRAWAQRLAEQLTAAFPVKHTAEYTRLGWCYLKLGVSGEWQGAWLMLVRRALLYCTAGAGAGGGGALTTLDLRKARSIALQRDDDASQNGSHSNVVRVDCCAATGALYLRWGGGGGGAEAEAERWRSVLRLAATNNGAALHHQQLTQGDVPVLVEKCMAFVCAHGCVSEGVYRRGGGASAVGQLLAALRRDAWAAGLCPQQYSEHDVAAALKRFFRDLPEPLLPHSTHQSLIQAMDIEDVSSRHTQLRRTLNSLGLVARNTARALFAHLHLVASLAERNKMCAGNLAAVWAPTLMPAPAPLTPSSLSAAWSAREVGVVGVVKELIEQWGGVWRPGPAELGREAALRAALLRAAGQPRAAPRAGPLRLWIAVHEPGNTLHIEVSAGKRAWDAISEAASRAGAEPHCLALEERALGGALRRTLHPDELLLPTVLRWAYWDYQDRKDNYLCVVATGPLRQTVLGAAAQAHAGTGSVRGELRYAAANTKILRAHHFQLGNGKLVYFKDKQGSVIGGEWSVREMVWYWGHEPRRAVRARWALTFVPAHHHRHANRSKERPWFGSVVAGGVTAERGPWEAALWRELHPDNFAALPQPPLIVT